MSRNHYVYVYTDSRYLYKRKNSLNIKHLPIYIGMGKDDRAYFHLKYKSHNNMLRSYIKEMKKQNITPDVKIIRENMSRKKALEYETKLIKEFGVIYGLKGPLFNKMIGGCYYSTKDKSYYDLLLKEYHNIILSDYQGYEMFDFIRYTPKILWEVPHYPDQIDNDTFDYKCEAPISVVNLSLPKCIIHRLEKYIRIGFTLQQCNKMFGVSEEHIYFNLPKPFLDKWVV